MIFLEVIDPKSTILQDKNIMFQHYPLLETVPITEFTSVKVTDDFNPMYDIEKTTKEDSAIYCQSLFEKIFSLEYSKIPDFIDHHCKIANNPTKWLNMLEELILVNSMIFQNNNNGGQLIKIQASIEVKRYRMNLESPHEIKDQPKPDRKFINAESNDRYFSFEELKDKLHKLSVFEEKLALLTNEKYDYLQAVITFENKELPKFDKQCNIEMKRLKEVKALDQELSKTVKSRLPNRKPGDKIKMNCNINQLVQVFYDLSREQKIEGKPILEGSTGDFAALISNNFVDKDGHEFSATTVETIFRPSRGDKRPKTHNRISVGKLL